MLSDGYPSSTAVNIRFALSVLEQALDAGEPNVVGERQHWLELDYDTGQGLLLLISEIDRAVGELVEALSELKRDTASE